MDSFSVSSITTKIAPEEPLWTSSTLDILPKAESAFILRRFEDCIQICLKGLHPLCHLRFGVDGKATGQHDNPQDVATLMGQLDALCHECRFIQMQHIPSTAPVDLRKLNHNMQKEDSQLQHHQASSSVNQCECVPFVAILIQSIFELDQQINFSQPVSDIALNFLSNFYGNINKVPFQLMYLCINRLVMNGYLDTAKTMLQYLLNRHSNNSHADRQDQDTVPESISFQDELTDQEYELLVQVYVIHVLPALHLWEEALEFLNIVHRLPTWKIQLLKDHVLSLKASLTAQVQASTIQPSEDTIRDPPTPSPESPSSTSATPSQLLSTQQTAEQSLLPVSTSKAKEFPFNLFEYLRRHYNVLFYTLSLLLVFTIYTQRHRFIQQSHTQKQDSEKRSVPRRIERKTVTRNQQRQQTGNVSGNTLLSSLSELLFSIFQSKSF